MEIRFKIKHELQNRYKYLKLSKHFILIISLIIVYFSLCLLL